MMCRKLFFAAFVLAVFALSEARAQTVEGYKALLEQQIVTQQTPKGANVTVFEHGDATEAVRAAEGRKSPVRINGYRVCIFFDNSPNARTEAVAARTLFEEHFAGIPLYMEYENPYFRVTVGNCATIEEAIILKGRVAPYFPKAFPKSQELTLGELLK